MLAVIISGDGGWRDLDQTIARDLQSWGVSVAGVDSLRYFWNHKSPEQAADDLARVIRYLHDALAREEHGTHWLLVRRRCAALRL